MSDTPPKWDDTTASHLTEAQHRYSRNPIDGFVDHEKRIRGMEKCITAMAATAVAEAEATTANGRWLRAGTALAGAVLVVALSGVGWIVITTAQSDTQIGMMQRQLDRIERVVDRR